MSSTNILLVWDRMGHYHVARWRALQAAHIGQVYAADLGAADDLYGWESELTDDPNYVRLSDKPVQVPDLLTRFARFRQVCQERNIKVAGIAGYGRKEYLLMLAWCKLKGIKTVLFAESWYASTGSAEKLKSAFLDRLCTGYLVSGSRAATHFKERLGLKKPLQIGYSVVDNSHFAKAIALRVDSPNVILCVARFAPEKDLPTLVAAFLKSSLAEQGWQLKLVGGGPDKKELEAVIASNANIELQKWAPYDQLPALYASASVFVLPSVFEPWGLVVNEALAAGLTCICSDAVGALPDLLPLDYPHCFEAGNVNALANCLVEVSADPLKFSLHIPAGFSCKDWAASFMQLAG